MSSPRTAAPPKGQKPTRARYWVIVFAVTLAILAYIDRVCISQAAPVISKDLGPQQVSDGTRLLILRTRLRALRNSRWLDGGLDGPRRVLMRIVIWWSVFTAVTGGVWNFTSLWVTRFLFGAGEAGCFPNLTKAFTTWLPQNERVKAQGIMWMFARWGGAFTPPLVILTFNYVSWRWAFVIFGALGIIWAVCFYAWFRDNPRDQKGVNEAELALLAGSENLASGHGDVPWGKMVGSRSVWLLWAQYFCISYPWYFYITWLPTYLQEYRHLTPLESSKYAILPLFFGGFGNLLCGFVSSHLARWTGSVTLSRRITGTVGFFGAAMCLLVSMHMDSPLWGMIAMGFASFFNDLVMPGAWGSCMDIGGKYAGTLSGSMNMMGNLAGFVAPAMGGFILQRTGGDWNLFLYTMVGMYLLGTLCWPFIDPVTRIDQD